VKLRLALMWLAGIDLRLTILAVPPVLPMIHRDLHLSETMVAVVNNLPVLTLAGSSIFGSLLVTKLGTRKALVAGLIVIAVASGLRGMGPSLWFLLLTTFVMGLGVAALQPVFPSISRDWFPGRVALATSVWTNGLLVGESLAAALTLPFVLPLVGMSWEWSFVVWAAIVAATALIVALFAPREGHRTQQTQTAHWFPDFRDERVWQAGTLQAAASLTYFGANTFIPDYLHATSQPQFLAPALAALNIGQLPASLAFGVIPLRAIARAEVSIVMALLLAGAVVLFLVGGGWLAVAAAAFIGFWAAYTLVLSFAIPALVAAPGEVSRMSAGVFTIGYSGAFLASLLSGAIWDLTHLSATAFLPVGAAVIIMIVIGPRLSAAAHRAELG
jgi:CP family cyanate transporter-like MFS transporter